jgi:hypothetical protein
MILTRLARVKSYGLNRVWGPNAVANSVDADAYDLPGTCWGCAKIGNVQLSVGPESHASGNREASGNILNHSIAPYADDFSVSRRGITVSSR